MDDSQAIQRLKDGDIGGLEYLVVRYQAKAVRAAYLVTYDETLAEDVVQDTSYVSITASTTSIHPALLSHTCYEVWSMPH